MAASPTPAQLLAQAKGASGGNAWDHIRTLRIEVTMQSGGLSGTGTELEDLTDGRSVTHIKLGSLSLARGFDGTMGWRRSPNGEVSPDDSAAAKQMDVTRAYRIARGWWSPKRWTAKIDSLGTRVGEGKTYKVLRITPQGGRPFELWIDAETHLIARIVETTGPGSRIATSYFSDYRTIQGIKIPFRELNSNGDKRHNTTILVTHVAVNIPVTNADFAMPGQALNGFSIAGDAAEATVPFTLMYNVVFVPVSVNGRPLRFMLDSGGGNVLTASAAKSADIRSEGKLESGGFGKKSVNMGYGKVKDLTLGGKITLDNQLFRVLAAPNISEYLGVGFDGSVGYGVLKHFVVRIDYAKRILTFILPQDFKPMDAGTAVPFTFLGHIPIIKGSIDGFTGEFMIDTGSYYGLSLFSSFAKAHDLNARYTATPVTLLGFGYGGTVSGRVTRGGTLMIGNMAVPNPVIALPTTEQGVADSKYGGGIIGGGILKRFTVTFDYATQTIYLKPNKNFGKPMVYDRSGMWINGANGGFVVKAVLSGGPAEQAGLQPGDVITKVDGTPASTISLYDMREKLRDEAPGTRVTLAVSRSGRTRTVTLALRRLIPKIGGMKKAT